MRKGTWNKGERERGKGKGKGKGERKPVIEHRHNLDFTLDAFVDNRTSDVITSKNLMKFL